MDKEIIEKIKAVCDVELSATEIAKFLLNEVVGVCNKKNVEFTIFPPNLLLILLKLRKLRAITNTQIRDMLIYEIDWKLNASK